jgi:hypothetical protein
MSIGEYTVYIDDNIKSLPIDANLCKNMYSYEPLSYKLFYSLPIYDAVGGLGNIRLKWYDWALVRKHFYKYHVDDGSKYWSDLYGLNVYKLHRKHDFGIP